jgi:urease accessory protein
MISPAFPVGAFSYSSGLEFAIENGWVNDEQSSKEWIIGLIRNNFTHLDVPIFLRVYEAFKKDDFAHINHWNEILLASRETAELKQEDINLGATLMKILTDLESAPPEDLILPISFATSFAYGAHLWNIEPQEAAMGLMWGWSENQVAAAIKLIPLGQTAGQRILSEVINILPQVLEEAYRLNDEDIGFSAPGLAMASAFHEDQYSRLFRS